jgi:uncharacterized repeat protein (TIGR03803 family)
MTLRIPVLAALSALILTVPAASSAVGSFHSFAGPEGATPAAPLVQGVDGFLYGVAAHGGDATVMPPDGGGTVFRTDGSGNVTTLHVFDGLSGAVPTGIALGRDGAFYGTTTYGGAPGLSSLTPGNGTIFRMDATGVFTMLFVFPGGERGFQPGPLMQGSDGALYGTALGGTALVAPRPGLVYRFDPVTLEYRILHTFVSDQGVYLQGRTPTGKLFEAGDGFLYGTTRLGGPSNAGVVYKIDRAGTLATVHAFSTFEGSEPEAGVFQASDGLFYGTLERGGYGGKIFRLDAAGNVTILHAFGPYSADGWAPVTNPIEARDGYLYGTTPLGGTSPSGSFGVVYRLAKTGGLTVLHSFSGADGIRPSAALVQAADGALYGSTIVGGASGLGTLFRLGSATPPPPPPPPPPPTLPELASLAISPAYVVGGNSALATVTLDAAAPAGGATVSVSSTSTFASAPATVTVPAAARTASFAVATRRTKKTVVATIRAAYAGSARSATLTIVR